MRTSSILLALSAVFAVPAAAFSTFNNCSGTQKQLPSNTASETLPQIASTTIGGWEQWEFAISQVNDSVIFFRWYAGEEGSTTSDPSVATFEVDAFFSNGTEYNTTLTGTIVSTSSKGKYSIAIGCNTLSWDSSLGTYSVSVSIDGFETDLTTTVVPASPFTPALDGVQNQLSQGLFFNVPIPVGFISGRVTWPWKTKTTINDVASLRHSWAAAPIHSVVKGYARISSWDGAFGVNWVQANDTTGTLVNATQVSTSSPKSLIYEFTQEPTLLTISTIPTNPRNPTAAASTNLTYAGCARTNDVSLQWITSTSKLLGVTTDSAGGSKTYYTISINATSPFPGSLTSPLAPIGLLEIYRSNQGATATNTTSTVVSSTISSTQVSSSTVKTSSTAKTTSVRHGRF